MTSQNVLNLTEKETKAFEERSSKIRHDDEVGWEKAHTLIRTLGMGGLWRGVFASIVLAYEFEHDSDVKEHPEDAISIIVSKQVAPSGVLE